MGVWISVVVITVSADDVVICDGPVSVLESVVIVINGWCYACAIQGGRIVVSLFFWSPPTVLSIKVWEGVMGSHVIGALTLKLFRHFI